MDVIGYALAQALPAGGTTADSGPWAAKAAYPEARQKGLAASTLPDGSIFATGGQVSNDASARADTYRYDPAADTWTAKAPLPKTLWNHVQVLLDNGLVLVAGGSSYAGGTSANTTSYAYDPTANTWTTKATHASGYEDGAATAAAMATNKALMVTWLGAQRYDYAANTWTAAAANLNEQGNAAACRLTDGSVLVSGGEASTARGQLCHLYDPVANTWTAKATILESRYYAGAVRAADGAVWLVGGSSYRGATTIATRIPLRYDPTANTWTAGGQPLPPDSTSENTAYGGHAVAITGAGTILSMTGAGMPTPYTKVYAYTPAVAVPAARRSALLAHLAAS